MKAEIAKAKSPKHGAGKKMRTLLSMMLVLLLAGLIVCAPTRQAQAEETGTDGTVTTPTITPVEPTYENAAWQIGTAEELYWFAGYVNGTQATTKENVTTNAVLTADIVINKVDMLNEDGTLKADASNLVAWVPIGNTTKIDGSTYQPNKAYGGTFDGQGHTISGLYYEAIADTVTGGLFGSVTGTVKRVCLVNSYIEGDGIGYVGGICGYIRGGTILACYNTATVEGSGICGSFCNGEISYCYNAGVVSAYGISGTTGNGLYLTAKLSYCVTETGEICNALSAGHDIKEVYSGVTAERLASGEMTYILNGKVSADVADAVLYWYQNLESDEIPVLDAAHGKIYEDAACENNKVWRLYTNEDRTPAHEYTENGVLCDYCYDIKPEKVSELIKDNVWQIDSAEDLYYFADYYNNYVCYESEEATDKGTPAYTDAILLEDIDLNEAMSGIDLTIVNTSGVLVDASGNVIDTSAWTQWTPIGKNRSYTGTFDGNGHVISHLFINQPEASGWALICSGGDATVVKNLGVRDSFICGTKSLAGIKTGAGSVTNCFSNCTIVSTFYTTSSSYETHYYYVGGLASGGVVKNSYCYGYMFFNYGAGNQKYYVGPSTENCFYVAHMADYLDKSGLGGVDNADGITEITDTQVTDGSLAHMLQQTYLEGEKYWSQDLDTVGYPLPVAGAKIEHEYDTTTHRCCCGAYIWDENLTVDFFADAPELVDGVYQISNVAELYWFAGLVNGDKRVCKDGVEQNRVANAVLTADITVNSKVLQDDMATVVEDTSALIPWIPIGMYDPTQNIDGSYTGTFDGQGYAISGLYLPYDKYYSAGLFGSANGGTVQRVVLKDSYVTGTQYVGGISGYSGTIKACYSDAMVAGTTGYVGGLSGYGSASYSYYAGQYAYAIGALTNATADHCASDTALYKSIVSGYYYVIKNCIKDIETSPVIVNGKGSYVSGSMPTTYTIATEDILASGELTYLLNGEVSADAADATLYWYQEIGKDGVPTLNVSDAGMVYAMQACPNTTKLKFSNGVGTTVHMYSDGYVCDYCYTIKENADFIAEDGITWQIGDATGLYAFNKYMNNYSNPTAINVELTADIDLNPGMDLTLDSTTKQLVNTKDLINWIPIGTSSSNYTGTFDGQGHTISHLYVFNDNSYVGLFGRSGSATIKNVSLVDSYIYGASNFGSFGYGGTISNCFSNAILNARGSVAGIARSATVNNSCYTGIVYVRSGYSSGTTYYVGITNSTATNCYYEGAGKGFWCNNSGIWTSFALNGNGTVVTQEQLSSGEVTYLLNGSSSEGDLVWYQTLGEDAYPVLDSTHGTVYSVQSCDGATTMYRNVNENASCVDEDADGCCDICTADMDGVILAGHNLILGELIAVNFYFELDETKNDFTGAYVKLSKDGAEAEKVLVDEAKTNTTIASGKTYYVFTYEVAAKEMEQIITANFYDAEDTLLLETTYSVAEYAEDTLADGSGAAEDTKAMVNAMITYGDFAAAYFDETEADTEVDLTPVKDIVSVLSGQELSTNSEAEFIRYAGSSLILLSNTTMRIYFELLGETAIENVTFTWNGSSLTPTAFVQGGKTYYYVDAADIKPKNLDASIGITATVDGSTYTATLSPLYYIKEMLDGGTEDEKLIRLLQALYDYYTTAEKYN